MNLRSWPLLSILLLTLFHVLLNFSLLGRGSWLHSVDCPWTPDCDSYATVKRFCPLLDTQAEIAFLESYFWSSSVCPFHSLTSASSLQFDSNCTASGGEGNWNIFFTWSLINIRLQLTFFTCAISEHLHFHYSHWPLYERHLYSDVSCRRGVVLAGEFPCLYHSHCTNELWTYGVSSR